MKRLLAAALCISMPITGGLASRASQGRAASLPPLETAHAMVVTSQHLATDIGVQILKEGGNAVDAAVAVGYALAVVHPCCGNIGGGGFMTIHLANGKNVFINFREKAPMAATRNMYLDASGKIIPGASTVGYKAIGVPGTVLGMDTALRDYGTMTRKQVMAPAIALAAKGYVLEPGDVALLNDGTQAFAAQPNVAAIFLKNGQPYQAGDRLVQSNLAASLQMIADQGPDAFYKGSIADAIVVASQAHGGLLTKADLANYTVEAEQPVSCNYRGYTVISSPPPSSGGTTLCEILDTLNGYNLSSMGFHSAASVHFTVEAMRHAYLDRNTYLGDPDFVKNPIAQLLSPSYIGKIHSEISPSQAMPSAALSPGLGTPSEGNNTTHYSIVDSQGNAVAVTFTINFFFGAGVIAGNTGFFLNDEMDDFTSKVGVPNAYGLVQGAANSIAPGKRPLSSMSPTIVLRNGKIFMVVGSPGGSKIITITLEVIQNVVDYGMNIQEAVDAPRFHHQYLPDTISFEPYTFSPDTMALLKGAGYTLQPSSTWGAAEAILVDPKTGLLYGGSDSRYPQAPPRGIDQ